MIPYPLNYVWDIFQWMYYEDHLIHGDNQIKIGRFDISSKKLKYRKYGEFFIPEKGQYIQNKNKLVCFHRDDDADALAYMTILIANKDSDNILQIQELTTKEDLSSVPESVVKQIVEDFKKDKKGAIPLLNVKTNPILLESMMDNNSLKALKQIDESPLAWMQDNIMLVAIIAVCIVAAIYILSGGKI